MMGKKGSRGVRLRERKTGFIDIFRTTPPETVCPNFYVLAHANGCAFAPQCHYCYLKSTFWYLRDQVAFTNVDRIVEEAREWIRQDDLESYVLNTGNLSDSMAFEKARPLIGRLVEVFREEAEAKRRPHVLLLVTKGGVKHCEAVISTRPCRNVVVSFSVNSNEAARAYERGAAEVGDRLEAVRGLKEAGWRVRMRIDPMIVGFDYAWIIEEVRKLACERVTLGTLRAEASLLRTVDHGMFEELEAPAKEGGLSRYPRATRVALYRQAVEAIRDASPLALCEEPEDVWRELGLDVEGKRCNCQL